MAWWEGDAGVLRVKVFRRGRTCAEEEPSDVAETPNIQHGCARVGSGGRGERRVGATPQSPELRAATPTRVNSLNERQLNFQPARILSYCEVRSVLSSDGSQLTSAIGICCLEPPFLLCHLTI